MKSRRTVTSGVTFIEICLAAVVLGLALIPVFALITGGLVRTDLNVSYTTASQILRSVMNDLLSDSFPFRQIPISPPDTYRDPAGSVAGDALLDPIFAGDDYEVDDDGLRRTIFLNGLHYYVEIWTVNYGEDDDLTFSVLDSPVVDFFADEKFATQLLLSDGDYDDFSPYNPSVPASHLVTGAPWAQGVRTFTQRDLAEEDVLDDGSEVYRNLLKIVLRVSWETGADYRRSRTQVTRDLWLVSFRGNLSE